MENRGEVGRSDLKARGDGLERGVGKARPEVRLELFQRRALALEDASPPESLGDALGRYHRSVTPCSGP